MPAGRLNQTLLGKYRLVALLASGGQSSVYSAHGPGGERLAVKIALPRAVDSASGTRMEREAAILARLRSPRFARHVDSGYDPDTGIFCLVQELLPGVSLDLVLRREEWLGIEGVVQVVDQVAQGLEELHALDWIMRDLAPSQVMVHGVPGGIRAWLIDLGLVRRGDGGTDLTDPAAAAGTPGYTAPELTSGRPPSVRSDVYSLGALTYALLSGDHPFAGGSPEGTIALQLLGEFPTISAAETRLGRDRLPGIERLLERTLSPDEDLRPATPREFCTLLSECLSAPPGTARLVAACLAAGAVAAAFTWWYLSC